MIFDRYYDYNKAKEGFVIPVALSGNKYLTANTSNGKITGFTFLKEVVFDFDSNNIFYAQKHMISDIGGKCIYAFLKKDGEFIMGNARVIFDELNSYEAKNNFVQDELDNFIEEYLAINKNKNKDFEI